MTNFQKRVYNLIQKIPRGRVTTYGLIAKKLGSIGFSRAVGNALNKNKNFRKVPCHRVVKSNGQLGGYRFGKIKKRELLKREGVKIKNGKIINFNKLLFKF
ncbi:MGMT family protein [bacterium]|nr:MGMT family protein [bacterium]